MHRGEIWWVDFSMSVGGEIQKIRPAIIVSNDASNKNMNRVQVVPITTSTSKCYPCEAYVKVNGKVGKAMADQLMTVSKMRLKTKMGDIPEKDLSDVERAIKIQLCL